MSGLHVGWLDLIIVVVIVASAIYAAYRGFVRETLSIFSWLAAAFAALYFGRYAVPMMRDHFSPVVAQIAAYSIVFLLVLLPLSFISYRFAQGVKDSAVGTLDGSLGAAFGVLRGLFIVALAYILFSLAVPVKTQPGWVANAELTPMVQTSADVILSLIPDESARYIKNHTIGSTARNEAPAPQVAPKPSGHPTKLAKDRKPHRKGYGAADRRALDRLFEATGGNGGH